ncbi:GNAT family N-acetyltransferase [Luteimonas deserti]|uniref:GNAT family N-acetyltransferase n=1 Tax=Luteimonas deserti TaxID=2752306 RepID=UPI001C5C96BB|nr:GNAT family N-acetyltransferase [Luteimonas deserti]
MTPALDRDRPALFSIYARAKLDALRNEPVVPPLRPLQDDAARLAVSEASRVRVAAADDVLGFGACTPGRIGMLFVDPAGRGRGIGTALLARMLEGMDAAVDLDVVASDTAARALYDRAGFRFDSRVRVACNGMAVEVSGLRRPASSADATIRRA